ncbi:MAG TPA: sigma-70 family RNA polymerase sigma factor, partial [Solirubrobacteraceae bacterium]|nr:sigma-70 family RNA polymerase sigma factor [Solirubrobacteraceae bacterium]
MSRAPSERPSAFSPLGLLSDERLGSMAAAGSTAAFAVLYERHAQGLYRFCRSITREEADAQDALQSAMERALRAMRRGARDAPVRPWLFRIAHNEAVSVLRRRARAADLGEQLPTGTAPSAEQVLAERLRLEQLLSDLAELPERQRVALVLRELSGLSHREIGLVFQISEGAAKQSIFEARTALAELERGRVMDCVDVRQRISDRDGRVLRSRRVRAHLRGCAECTRFRLAMGQRPAELAALAPVLPGTAIAGVLARALTGTPIRSAASTSTSASAGGVAASALGKAGGGLAVKALVS